MDAQAFTAFPTNGSPTGNTNQELTPDLHNSRQRLVFLRETELTPYKH